MDMSELYSSDVAACGVYRAVVVKYLPDGRAHIFIPQLHKKLMPFSDPSDMSSVMNGVEENYPLANGCCYKVHSKMEPGESVWVSFENGDLNHPIILGNFATTVDIVTPGMAGSGTSEGSGMYSDVEGINENDNFYKIYNYFAGLGYPMAAICGILGNMKCENSTFDPAKEGPDSSGRALGICQFNTKGRGGADYKNVKDHCGSYSYDSLEGQLEFLKWELTTNFKDLDSKLRSVPDSQQGAHNAAHYFCSMYEKCAGYKFMGSSPGDFNSMKSKYVKDSSKFDSIAASVTSNNNERNVYKRGLWAIYYYDCFSAAPKPTAAGGTGANNGNLTEKQQKVIAFAETYGGDANSSQKGHCQAWVADVYAKALGISRQSANSAGDAGMQWGVRALEGFPDYQNKTASMKKCSVSEIPIGACVYMLYSPSKGTLGHVGIYYGNGTIIGNHGWRGDKVPAIRSLEDYKSAKYLGFLWGWNGNVSLL